MIEMFLTIIDALLCSLNMKYKPTLNNIENTWDNMKIEMFYHPWWMLTLQICTVNMTRYMFKQQTNTH